MGPGGLAMTGVSTRPAISHQRRLHNRPCANQLITIVNHRFPFDTDVKQCITRSVLGWVIPGAVDCKPKIYTGHAEELDGSFEKCIEA